MKDNKYLELLKAIKDTKEEENYKPSDYKFGLNNFDENGIYKDNKKRATNVTLSVEIFASIIR